MTSSPGPGRIGDGLSDDDSGLRRPPRGRVRAGDAPPRVLRGPSSPRRAPRRRPRTDPDIPSPSISVGRCPCSALPISTNPAFRGSWGWARYACFRPLWPQALACRAPSPRFRIKTARRPDAPVLAYPACPGVPEMRSLRRWRVLAPCAERHRGSRLRNGSSGCPGSFRGEAAAPTPWAPRVRGGRGRACESSWRPNQRRR